MKIAIAQLNYTIGDVDGNASKIIDSINKAKAQRADLVIFAEQAVSGTPAFDLLRKTTFLELCEDALVEIASCCDGIAAIVGLPILTNNGTISAAALIQDRKVLRYVGKKYITARREMGFLTPSKGFEYATIKGHKCAIIVGDDLSREHDFDQSVETVISINARKYGKGTMTYRYEMMRHLAFVEGKNLVLVNQVGGSTDIVYDGTSGALNSRGELLLTYTDGRVQNVGIVTGAQGEKGDKGDTGAQGEKGDKGDKGDTGAQGEKGEKGDKGDTGAAGKDGANGVDGKDGINGTDGKDGVNGVDGQDGVGIQTITITDDGKLQISLTNGTTLDLGTIKGEKGEKGEKGDKGDTGATGAQGEKGEKGETGAAGPNRIGAETAADFEGLIKGAGGWAAQAVSGVDYAAAAHSHGMSDVSGLEAALGGKQPKKLLRAGAAVAASDWTDDAEGRYADYPKTALIAVEGAQESMLPEVIFSVADALSGNFAPAAVSVGGGVRIYAKEVPEGSVTVTAVLWA